MTACPPALEVLMLGNEDIECQHTPVALDDDQRALQAEYRTLLAGMRVMEAAQEPQP